LAKSPEKGTWAAAWVATARVKPYSRNPRRNEHAVAKTAASIQAFGWRQPIVVDRAMVIVAGHTRLLAAQSLGLAEVPVHIASDLTPAQAKAYRLADNRVGEEAEWDMPALRLEMKELEAMSFDMGLMGFDGPEIRALCRGVLAENPDDVVPVPTEPITQPGDLILLGRHRLLCGDATSASDVARLLADARPALMVTDPPYGVEYRPEWRNEALAPADRRQGLVQNDDRVDWSEAWALFPGDVVYCWHADRHASAVQASLERSGFDVRGQIIWAKPRFVISRGHYHWQHEPCWYAVRRGATGAWIGNRSQTTLWEIPLLDDVDAKVHGTQKPTACMERPLINHAGDVYDPFAGTGTTLIAAERQGRTAYLLEIDPGYCDVIVTRWERATGAKAQRA
jgi:DNA modification methylase